MAAHLQGLATEIDATRRDAGFLDALDTMARFWRYAWGNQQLIRTQRPSATHVGAKSLWLSLGRWLKRGVKAIQILAPAPGLAPPFVLVKVYD